MIKMALVHFKIKIIVLLLKSCKRRAKSIWVLLPPF